MEIQMRELPEIAIIGKEGLCTAEHNVAQELWAQANAHFAEVAELAMREADGSFVGFWGAMSDVNMNYLPWEDEFSRGMYLAGVEVAREAEPPRGWTRWILPARSYLIVDVTSESYGEIFGEMIRQVIPDRGLTLCGAVCDFIEPATGQSKLFFPVQ